MKKLVISFLSVAMLYSCSTDSDFKEELSIVDSLQTELEMLESRMDSADVPQLPIEQREISELNSYLLNNYPDSIDRNFWIREMSNMRRVQKAYDRFLSARTEIREKIELTEKQLSGLENSLDDEKLSKELANEYVEVEKKAVAEISFMVGKLQPELKVSRGIWQEMREKMHTKADSIREYEPEIK